MRMREEEGLGERERGRWKLETEAAVLVVMYEGEELVSVDERVSHWEFLCLAVFCARWWSLYSAELRGQQFSLFGLWVLTPGPYFQASHWPPLWPCTRGCPSLVCVNSAFQLLMSFHISYLWYFFIHLYYLWEEGRAGKSNTIYQIKVRPKGTEGFSQDHWSC